MRQFQAEIERIGEQADDLGESPVWDIREQVLYWVDGLRPAVYRHDPATSQTREWLLDSKVGSLALREQGGLVLACADGFHLFDFDTGARTPIADPEAHEPRTRFNDGKVDRRGRFIAGSVGQSFDEQVAGLYALDPDRSVRRLDEGYVCVNGPCWSPDGSTFYVADTGKAVIYAFDYDLDTGATANKRIHIDTRLHDGHPDGATVDTTGCLWTAFPNAGRIVRFTPDGLPDGYIQFPITPITSLTFGGPDLTTPYVTSLSTPTFATPAPDNGALYAVRLRGLHVQGIAEPRFAG